ncbi:MAG TPA: hypothetical protein VGX78_01120 [Pirellulales bacterium]|jgi:hypothetical protein|nr:hypothetical protein [Pirellulales bacterium]
MPSLTIELEPSKYAALNAMAKEQGLASAEQFLVNQVESLLARKGQDMRGVHPNLASHLDASIEENRGLLKRLAK